MKLKIELTAASRVLERRPRQEARTVRERVDRANDLID